MRSAQCQYVTGLIVIVLGDAWERRRDPSRGFTTLRAMRNDAIVVTAVPDELASVDLNAIVRRLKTYGQRTQLRKG